MTMLNDWANFYLIVGPSAGALIGLQFVVITLIGDAPLEQRDVQASGAFATPSVVHFTAVLFLSAIVVAPWPDLTAVAVFWGLLGLVGVFYTVIVTRRFVTQTAYKPVFEDYLFHVLLPFAAYIALAASTVLARYHERPALFLVAAAALLLLWVGIHNAWDTVIYHTFVKKAQQKKSDEAGSES